MSKEVLKDLIDLLDEKDTETIFKILVRFVPDGIPFPDEIEAIKRANGSIEEQGTVPHDLINWE